MLCSGEEYLGIISSEKEWTEMMDERLLIPATNTTTTCSSSGSGSGSGMTNPSTNKNSMAVRVSDKPTQTQAQALRCPRCDSSNTKFCYYNNYSLSQPRHFCKACKRYWTRGGMLRNIPVGGGCRKNKRARKPSAAAAPRTLRPPPPPDPIASSACLDPSAIYALQAAVSPLPILPTAFDMPPPPHLGGFALDLQALPPSRLLDEYPHYVSNLSPSSLLLSGIKQPKQLEDYQTMLHIDELQASEINGSIKLETQSNNTMSINTIDWLTVPQEISLGNLGPAAALYWNAGIGGSSWPDGVNCGSSVPSLI